MAEVPAVMQQLSLLPIKIIAAIALVLWMGAGVYLFKHQERLFGADPELPSESSGAQGYSKAQAWIVWLLFAKLFAFLAFAI